LKSIRLIIFFALFLSAQQGSCLESFDAAKYVNPFIGTGKYDGPSRWGHYGGAYPGAVVPFGLVQVSPETRLTGDPLGYYYEDDRIYAFSTVGHMSGYPSGSAGKIKFMPVQSTGDDSVHFSFFSHDNEIAEPGYYAVDLFENSIRVELTATERTALVRLQYDDKATMTVVFSAVDYLDKNDQNVISGKSGGYYFYILFDQKIKELENYHLNFGRKADGELRFKIAVSRVSIENAKQNMLTENSAWDFEFVKQQARQKWNSHLSKIEIKGGDSDNESIFYTALYHSLLLPFVASDANGDYRGLDGKIRNLKTGDFYSGFSPWDTFRTLHPLLNLLEPQRQLDMIKSLLLMYEQTGSLFDGPMTGNHAIPIIVDSYFKGVADFDVDLAIKALKSSIWDRPYRKRDFENYVTNGFVVAELPESVTRTLEYAYNDWVLAEFLRDLEPATSERLLQRSFNYRTLFRAETGMMSPKYENGAWSDKGGYKEGDAWNYSWFVPHNIKDVVNMMGGESPFVNMLQAGYVDEKIIHDNEPVLNFAYLFNYAHAPWKTQQVVAELCNLYTNSPGGIPGNDDLGSMSSWFVFSALGIYPVCPGRPVYDITTPLFSDVTLHLDNQKDFRIVTTIDTIEAKFIDAAQLNELPLRQPWINHNDVLHGGLMQFSLSASPTEELTHYSDEAIPSIIKISPIFAMSDFHLTKSNVHPNQVFEARLRITNNGSGGSKYLYLFVDDVLTDSTLVFVGGSDNVDASFKIRLYKAGEHLIRVDSLPSQTIILVPDSDINTASLEYSDFLVEPLVRFEEPLSVFLSVKNIGAYDKNEFIRLYVGNQINNEKQVHLSPGERQKIEFTIPSLPIGLHTISINDSLTSTVKCYAEAVESCILDLSFEKHDEKKLFDNSGFNNRVTLVGVVKFVESTRGNGIITGKNGFVKIQDSPALNISGHTLSILAWVKPDHENVADFISKGDYNVLKMQNPTTLNFIAGGWGRGECMASVPENWNDSWHHLAGVYDVDELRLYVDGDLVQSIKVAGEIDESEFSWSIGRNVEIPFGRHTNGAIDEVKIFKEALEQTDIKKIMNSN
jgi:putative alpha-1,2-mannosidase